MFPDRSTRLVFNDYPGATVQPWVWINRNGSEMCRSSKSTVSNVSYRPHLGWMIRAYHQEPGASQWLSAPQTGTIIPSAGNAILASNFIEKNTFSQALISGVSYAAGVQSAGAPGIVHAPPAGADWSSDRLAADQTSYPPPDTSDDYTSMDRVLVSTPGAVEPWDTLQFIVVTPSSRVQARGSIATFYFNGPAGDDGSGLVGLGKYALKLRGDGNSDLYEKLTDNSWKKRFTFKWNTTNGPVQNTMIAITVTNDMWLDEHGAYQGTRMTFWNNDFHAGGLIAEMAQIAQTTIRFQYGMVPVYNVPRHTEAPTWVEPVRIDLARDCKAIARLCRHVYYDSGYLIDDFVSFDQPLTVDEPLYVVWSGSLPTGTGWDAQIYDENGAALTALTGVTTVNTNRGQAAWKAFTPVAGQRYAQTKYTLTSDSSKFRTPRLESFDYRRAPIYASNNPVSLVYVPDRATPLPSLYKTTVAGVAISPQQTDPGAENANFSVWDMTGALSFLEDRNMNPVRAEVWNGAQWCPTFSGYALEADGRRMRRPSGSTYPSDKWTDWSIACVGEWARTSEAIMATRMQWTDRTTGMPYKVTDALRIAMSQVYDDTMLYVPDNDVRIFGVDPSDYVSEPGTRVVDFCSEMGRDYLGGYWLFDEAAGDRGVMRFYLQKQAPYNNLAIFELDHPTVIAGDSLARMPQWSPAYGTSLIDGQEVQHTFIQAGTFHVKRERAEGNCVVTVGASAKLNASKSGAAEAAQLTQIAINVGSYNFLGLSPGDPGYPDGSSPEFFNRVVPIKVFDYKLPDQTAVDWKTRRVYEKACFSRYYLSFSAPMLLVTDVTDDLQRTPRRLRFYDPVLVRDYEGNLVQFLVLSCSPTYRKDSIQMANYVLVTQTNINQVGVMPHSYGEFLNSMMGAMAKVMGTGDKHNRQNFADQSQGLKINNPMLGLPTPSADPIQDLDNTSSTFGEFYFMPGYSAIGGPDVMRP